IIFIDPTAEREAQAGKLGKADAVTTEDDPGSGLTDGAGSINSVYDVRIEPYARVSGCHDRYRQRRTFHPPEQVFRPCPVPLRGAALHSRRSCRWCGRGAASLAFGFLRGATTFAFGVCRGTATLAVGVRRS